jgi:hypothetical protein
MTWRRENSGQKSARERRRHIPRISVRAHFDAREGAVRGGRRQSIAWVSKDVQIPVFVFDIVPHINFYGLSKRLILNISLYSLLLCFSNDSTL